MLRVHPALLLLAVLLHAPEPSWAQTVPARLALYSDPTPGTSSAEGLVLGSTTLDEARRLFPNAPTYAGPMPYPGNPNYMRHEPNLEIGGAIVKLRHEFFLGRGRAILYFDDHKRLVSITQGRFAYRDPVTDKLVIEELPWATTPLSRNDFHAHYPGTKGEWFDSFHYHIEGTIGECLALTAIPVPRSPAKVPDRCYQPSTQLELAGTKWLTGRDLSDSLVVASQLFH